MGASSITRMQLRQNGEVSLVSGAALLESLLESKDGFTQLKPGLPISFIGFTAMMQSLLVQRYFCSRPCSSSGPDKASTLSGWLEEVLGWVILAQPGESPRAVTPCNQKRALTLT